MKRALIVDDDKCVRQFMVIWLEHFGKFDIIDSAFDGEEALSMFEEGKYCVVILDIALSVMTGVDVCIKMREIDKNVRIVALTGYSNIVESCDLSIAGFDAVYLKPDGFKTLINDLEKDCFGT